jgi:PBSX family phage portal protein
MSDLAKKVTEVPFTAEVTNKNGAIVPRRFNARIVQIHNKKKEFKEKRQKIERQNQTQQGLKTSNITPLKGESYDTADFIDPPYDMLSLVVLEEESNILSECIGAMVTNIEGFGHIYRSRKIAEKDEKKFKNEIEQENIKLENWTDILSPEVSFIETRKRVRKDLELTGNGFLELVRLGSQIISEINHVVSHRMRLTKRDKDYTNYVTYVIDPENSYKIKQIERRKRFRRFVQLDEYGRKKVYFKEKGDPRKINKNTGEEDGSVSLEDEATEMVHFKIYSARTPYGIPRFVGRYVSILGSRRAEEVNFFTLSNNHVPSAFVIMENGTLTPKSIERLGEMLESQVASDPNYSKFVILEGEAAEEENFPGQSKSARIKIHEFDKARRTDEMYSEYDKANQKKTRRAFRLPPLLIGESDDYTRATARESIRVGDEQVFNPEREVFDSFMNSLMLDQGFRWHLFRSRTPNITDNLELAAIANVAERSGGMTPRRMNTIMEDAFEGEIGPMPQGIDLDSPYSLQFAKAQNAQTLTESKPIERSYDSWMDNYIKEFDIERSGSAYLDDFVQEFATGALH